MKKFGGIKELPISSQLCLLAHTTPFVLLLVQLVFDQTASPFSNFACTHKPSSLLLLNDENIHFYSQQSMQPNGKTDLHMRLLSYFDYLSAHLAFPPNVWKSIILTPLMNSHVSISAMTFILYWIPENWSITSQFDLCEMN